MKDQTCNQTCNQFATEYITKQAAIDALRVAYWDDNIQSAKDDPCIVDAMTDWAIRQVKALPPAQPESLVNESRPLVKDLVKDTISRQAAIDAFNTDEKNMITVVGMENAMILGKYLNRVLNKIKQLPSAQPTFDARDTQYNLPIGTDCISRQAAIAMCRKPRMRNADCSDFEMEIMMLPSAQPKMGMWVSKPYKRARICSCCGHDEPYKFADDDATIFNFCPNCGAKMVRGTVAIVGRGSGKSAAQLEAIKKELGFEE